MRAIFPPVLETVNKGHGRIETRSIQVSTVINGYLDFPYVGQVFRLFRKRENTNTGDVEQETVYGITSLAREMADPMRLLHLNRNHWSIENSSHYVRDMTFDEDRSQVRAGQGPRVMATLRNFGISLLRLGGNKNISSATRACQRKAKRALYLLGVY